MKSTSTINQRPFSADTSKPCPSCGGTAKIKPHHPVLTGRLPGRVALSPNDTNETERLRYVKAWVCETGTCDYWEVISEASTNAARS